MPRRVLALLVDDHEVIARTLRTFCSRQNYPIDLIEASSLGKALKILRADANKRSIDVVILDLLLPDSKGTETFYRLRRAFPDVSVIVFSGELEDPARIELAQNGAIDCVVKGSVEDLQRLCERAISEPERRETKTPEVTRSEIYRASKRLASVGHAIPYLRTIAAALATLAAAAAAWVSK